MELPGELRAAVESAAADIPLRELTALAGGLSQRYREQSGTGRSLLHGEAEAVAYACARMPATYAAVRTALGWALPGSGAYATMLDVGAGTGAAGWAAALELDGLCSLTCLEREEGMLRLGERLMCQSAAFAECEVRWLRGDIADGLPAGSYDLVTASYMMNELTEPARARLLEQLWSAAAGMLLIIEPGTPEGFRQLRAARRAITALGGHVAAPCPHEGECPLGADDWCHFTCRVARTRLHRLLKGGDAPYEDEKFAYMAFTRADAGRCGARILRHPQVEPGRVTLRLCTRAGLETRPVLKRDKAQFRAARKADCGDALPG